MGLFNKLRGSVKDARRNEDVVAELAKQQATIEYLAIMADVDLPNMEESEVSENE